MRNLVNPNTNITRPLSPHITIYKPQFTSTFSIYHRISGAFIATSIVLVFYLLCMKMGFMAYFILVLSKVGVLLGGRALSFFFIKMGCPGGKTLALFFYFWALVSASASTPPFGNAVSPGREPELELRLGQPGVQVEDPEGLSPAVSPGREPELELRLGQPGVQVEDPEGLSPAERQLIFRLTIEGREDISLDDVQAMARLKDDIVTRISELDPSPFWTEQRARVLSSYVVTPKGEQYSLTTLHKIALELGGASPQNHYFLKRMVKLRKEFELFGRFY